MHCARIKVLNNCWPLHHVSREGHAMLDACCIFRHPVRALMQISRVQGGWLLS